MKHKKQNLHTKQLNITAKIFGCNKQTYTKIYKDAIKKAYNEQNIEIDVENIKLEIVDLSNNGLKNIQQQRHASTAHNRSISVYENDNLKYIIGVSNTNYDEDKILECNMKKQVYNYDSYNYHANTYFLQGINRIFNYYFDEKKKNHNVQLYFYLLDTHEKYPHSLFNIFTYRMLATIGFSILNINDINFDEFKELNFTGKKAKDGIEYKSFNKFMNDMIYISKKNTGNMPPYLRCINENIYDENDNESIDNTNVKYIYTFKALGAGAYASFFGIWTLNVLAKQENKNIEFLLSKEKYNFKDTDKLKETKDLTKPIIKLFEKIEIHITYESTNEVLQQLEREKKQFEFLKDKNDLRNQELFRNNIRKKGILTKCCLCGCEVENILEAAHLWGVSEIKKESAANISKVLKVECMKDLVENKNSADIFSNKYMLANSGDNGVWMCRNHHGLFDNHYYCFNSKNGQVIYNISSETDVSDYINKITQYEKLDNEILSSKTKVFLEKRKEIFDSSSKNN